MRILISYEDSTKQVGTPVFSNFVTVGNEWTQLSLKNLKMETFAFAQVGIVVFENTSIYIDDISVKTPVWKMAEPVGTAITVGGVQVPETPAAPVMFTFAIHIEDPQILLTDKSFFVRKTAIFEELAKIFNQHGGILTIQPEIEWVKAASTYDPDALKRLATQYNVVYSTHTHGPACKDETGQPYGSAACSEHPDWSDTLNEDDVVTYIDERIDLIESLSETTVTDHNGNFDMINKDKLVDIGDKTLSAYKQKSTQQSYDYLVTNPWRPTNTDAETDISSFLIHDPN